MYIYYSCVIYIEFVLHADFFYLSFYKRVDSNYQSYIRACFCMIVM